MDEQLRRERIAAGQRQRWAEHDSSVAELDELLDYVRDGGRDPGHIASILAKVRSGLRAKERTATAADALGAPDLARALREAR